MLETLGHSVTIVDPDEVMQVECAGYDCFVGLHAGRSCAAIRRWRKQVPTRPVVVVLTGTDLHVELSMGGDPSAAVVESLRNADQIVLLEPEGMGKLPREFHSKCRVIFQSSTKQNATLQPEVGEFPVSMLAHLRDVKDPSLIVKALGYLPSESRIRVVHAGEATTKFWGHQAAQWDKHVPRYQWLGSVPHQQALALLAKSKLTVLTSQHEGAPGVFSEAAVHGVPVLATAITASRGILGGDHPGLFPVGDASALADLMWRAESDPRFYQQLASASSALCDRLSPDQEVQSWKDLINMLDFSWD